MSPGTPDTVKRRFPSQRDPQLVALLQRAAVLFLGGAGILALIAMRLGNDLLAMLGIVALALGIGCAWTVRVTWYEVTPERLRIRSGPSRMSIAWPDIVRIVPSQDRRNAPALSFDRLRIDYNQGRRTRTVLISPLTHEEFCRAVVDLAPWTAQGEALLRPSGEAQDTQRDGVGGSETQDPN